MGDMVITTPTLILKLTKERTKGAAISMKMLWELSIKMRAADSVGEGSFICKNCANGKIEMLLIVFVMLLLLCSISSVRHFCCCL